MRPGAARRTSQRRRNVSLIGRHAIAVALSLVGVALAALLACNAALARPEPLYCSRDYHPRGCIRVPSSARGRPRTGNQQGPASLTPTQVENGGGLGGGPGNHRATAIQWALTQLRLTRWAWWCERFVEEAYGSRYDYRTAAAAATRLHLHHEPITRAPRGSLVYFRADPSNRRYGHVGLSLGDGKMISALARVQKTDIAHSRYWRRLYVGWADAPGSWPGLIPPPPDISAPMPFSTVRISAPAFGETVSGTIQLTATASNVSGIEFEAYYATDPSNPAARGWVPLGVAQFDGASWSLNWNTQSIPDQGNPAWGTVNIAAVALNAHGQPTATQDYRRISIDNTTGGLGTTQTGSPTQTGTQTQPPPPVTFPEQEDPRFPSNTFTDYHNAAGKGTPVAPGQIVQVSCKIYDPTIASVYPDGYWYRIASSPWNNAYYAPANNFLNGDPYGGPYTHNTDPTVPNCSFERFLLPVTLAASALPTACRCGHMASRAVRHLARRSAGMSTLLWSTRHGYRGPPLIGGPTINCHGSPARNRLSLFQSP